DGIRDRTVTGVQTCALPISAPRPWPRRCTSRLRRSPSSGVAELDRLLAEHATWLRAVTSDRALAGGLNTLSGHVVNPAVAEALRSEERRVGKGGRSRRAPAR